VAYHDDLLQQALSLAHKEPKKPKQASLRRAVSTAYYALFHLLIHSGVANWSRPDLRHKVGRGFDHTNMRDASKRFQNAPVTFFGSSTPAVVAQLRRIAATFIQLQEQRHIADYDNGTSWTRTQALSHVRQVEQAFVDWAAIRNQPMSQEYLVALLVKKRT
jgi:uncharacterized protein (UPF0332 family)